MEICWQWGIGRLDFGMLDQLLKQLKTEVTTTGTLPEETREELLRQAEQLENRQPSEEVSEEEEAPNGAQEDVDKLISSIEGLEASHPVITSLVNRIAIALGNMGI